MRFSTALRWIVFAALAAPAVMVAQPSVTAGGIVNAASFVPGQPVAPGSIVAIFGQQLAGQLAQADSVPWSTSRANVTITFNGVAAPIQFVSQTQINAQVPWEAFPTGSGSGNVVVNNNGVPSAPQSVVVNSIA